MSLTITFKGSPKIKNLVMNCNDMLAEYCNNKLINLDSLKTNDIFKNKVLTHIYDELEANGIKNPTENAMYDDVKTMKWNSVIFAFNNAGGKAAKKVTTPKGERVVHKGPRGGEYVIYKGEKVSASRFAKKKAPARKHK